MKEESKKFHIGIGLIFLCSMCIYGTWVTCFTAPVHVKVDEELHLGLARTFHYQGFFGMGKQTYSYSCVLYSMLISIAYFWYTPEKILLLMRMINVFTLCSAVFPIGLLAVNILETRKSALRVTAFLMFFPYMFDCAYFMQEVLCYPLFMWTVYFLYSAKKMQSILRYVIAAVFSVLCLYTKTNMFFIPIIVNVYVLMELILQKDVKENWKREIRNILFFDGSYVALSGVFYLTLQMINGFERGVNHYERQLSWLFPVEWKTLGLGIIECILYASLFLVNMGIIPIYVCCHNKRKMDKATKYSFSFVGLSSAFMILETVFLIVLTEEGLQSIPHKFLFRYFQIFLPIYFLIYFKFYEEYTYFKEKAVLGIAWGSILVCTIYFSVMNGNTHQAIMDGYFFLIIENITKYICPYADIAILILIGLFITAVAIATAKGKLDGNKVCKNAVCTVVIMMGLINFIQLPLYTNKIAEGRQIQEDGIKIAEFLNQEGCNYIYYVDDGDPDNHYLKNVYGYLKQQYEVIDKDDMLNKMKDCPDKIAFLVPKSSLEEMDLGEKEIGTKKISLLYL